MRRLSMDLITLGEARENLVQADLIAFKKPLYQVLSLDKEKMAKPRPPSQPLSFEQIFNKALGGAP